MAKSDEKMKRDVLAKMDAYLSKTAGVPARAEGGTSPGGNLGAGRPATGRSAPTSPGGNLGAGRPATGRRAPTSPFEEAGQRWDRSLSESVDALMFVAVEAERAVKAGFSTDAMNRIGIAVRTWRQATDAYERACLDLDILEAKNGRADA